MNNIRVNICMSMNGSKINAIKEFRSIFNRGLAFSKEFIETHDNQWMTVIMTAEQFGNFVAASFNQCNGTLRDNSDFAIHNPCFSWENPSVVSSTAFDFTREA